MRVVSLLRSEIAKNFRTPILETILSLVFLSIVLTKSQYIYIFTAENFQHGIRTTIAKEMIYYLFTLDFPLSVISALITAMSFAGDYERGLLETLISLPISRISIVLMKICAIITPLTAISWVLILLNSGLDFGFSFYTLIAVSIPTVSVFFLSITFYTGLSALISLIIKKALPSVLISTVLVLMFNMVSKANPMSTDTNATWLLYTPSNTSIVALNAVLGTNYIPNLPFLDFGSLPLYHFVSLSIVYSAAFVALSCLFFKMRFEVTR